MKKNRTLIIILCETRGFRLTFARFKKHLLDVTQADLAICVADNEREDTNNPFYQAAKYIWKSGEYEDWGEGIEKLRSDYHPQWRILDRVPIQWLGGIKTETPHTGSGGIVFYFREFLRKCLRESDVYETYDHIILTRSDFVHEIPQVPFEMLDRKSIWVPDGEHYEGMEDRHIICPIAQIDKLLSVCDIFTQNPEGLVAEIAGERH